MLFFFKENKDCNQLNSMFSRGSIWKCFVYVVGLGHSGWNQTNKNRLFFSWTEPDFIFQMESLESAVVVFEGGRRFWRRAQLCRVIHCLFFSFVGPFRSTWLPTDWEWCGIEFEAHRPITVVRCCAIVPVLRTWNELFSVAFILFRFSFVLRRFFLFGELKFKLSRVGRGGLLLAFCFVVIVIFISVFS